MSRGKKRKPLRKDSKGVTATAQGFWFWQALFESFRKLFSSLKAKSRKKSFAEHIVSKLLRETLASAHDAQDISRGNRAGRYCYA